MAERFWAKVLLRAQSRAAWRRWSRGNAEGALRALREYYGRKGVQPPSDTIDHIHNLLFAEVCADLGAQAASLAACRVVKRQLEEGHQSGEINPADANYLLCVCRAVAASLSYREATVGYEARRFALGISADRSSVDHSKVSRWILNSFPLTDAFVEATEHLLVRDSFER